MSEPSPPGVHWQPIGALPRIRSMIDGWPDEGAVARTEPAPTGGAVVVGPLQLHGPLRRQDGLRLPAGVVRRVPAATGHGLAGMVRVIRVEPAGHGAGRHGQGSAARRRLHRLEV